ncbi:MAG: hypothetical protein ABI314_01245 [Gemmatimonadaceae bacterium]
MRTPSFCTVAASILLFAPAVAGAQQLRATGISPAHFSITDNPRNLGSVRSTAIELSHALPRAHLATGGAKFAIPRGLTGAVSGAIIGATAGYRAVGSSDGRPSASAVRQYVITGAVIGAVVGYGIESIIRSATGAPAPK